MGKHLVKNGFTSGYTQWVHHGEAYRLREKVVRPCLKDFDAKAGVADMIEDWHKGQCGEGRTDGAYREGVL
jgi:hypothetical protein